MKWISKFLFANFYMDDHLTQLVLLDKSKRVLDYNFMLWKYDTTKLDHESLAKLDKGSKEAEDPE